MKSILKNINLFVDGRGYAGAVEEFTPPKLTLKTEEYRPGGFDAAIEIETGMEKLEASFTLMNYDADAIKLFGVASGRKTPLTFRGSLKDERNGDESPVVITLRGLLKEVDRGSLKPGEMPKIKFMVACDYYKEVINGELIHEIDIPNMIRVVDGEDALEQTRRNLAI